MEMRDNVKIRNYKQYYINMSAEGGEVPGNAEKLEQHYETMKALKENNEGRRAEVFYFLLLFLSNVDMKDLQYFPKGCRSKTAVYLSAFYLYVGIWCRFVFAATGLLP
jgi:hypothetical protein